MDYANGYKTFIEENIIQIKSGIVENVDVSLKT